MGEKLVCDLRECFGFIEWFYLILIFSASTCEFFYSIFGFTVCLRGNGDDVLDVHEEKFLFFSVDLFQICL